MFDISWSELLILAIVTLIFVGPKELPRFLGILGRYAGVIRRQAQEFRAYFDEAMREAELEAIKKEVDTMRSDVEASVRDAGRSATSEIETAKRALEEDPAMGEPDREPKTTAALEAPSPRAPEPLPTEPMPSEKPGS
jgi:sec-independent protein translocase protein TatB